MSNILRISLSSVLLVLLSGAAALAQVTRQWVVSYDADNLDLRGAATQVLVDRQDDVYLVGDYAGDLLIAKYDATGLKLWDRRFVGKSPGSWAPSHTAVLDPLDHLVVVGPGGYVIKLDQDGHTAWEVSATAAVGHLADLVVAAVDGSGNILAAGRIDGGTQGPDALVVKYGANGDLLWSRVYDGAGGEDRIDVLRLAAGGNIIAGGSSSTGILVLAYDSAGNEAFVITDQSQQLGGVTDLDTDDAGDVLATGWQRDGEWSSGRAYVAKFDRTGSRLWLVADAGWGYTRSIRVDQQGSVYVAGATNPDGTFYRYMLRKYNSAGALSWSRTYYQYGDSEIFAMELDRGMEPVITGEFGFCYNSIRTMKFSTDGAIRWDNSYSTHYCGSVNYGLSVVLDSQRNVYVAGYTYDPAKGGWYAYKPTLIKYVQPVTVSIDVKPGQFPNAINLGSGGTVPVAILSTATFEATRVDPLSVTLASASVQLRGNGTIMASLQDVDGDGRLDMVIHVSTDALQLSDVDTAAILQGTTADGVQFEGVDSIRVVPQK